jgi:hypothetical protein
VETWWGHAFCIFVIDNINDTLNGSIMSDMCMQNDGERWGRTNSSLTFAFQYSTSRSDLGGRTECYLVISNNLAATMSSVDSSAVKGKSLSENMSQCWGGERSERWGYGRSLSSSYIRSHQDCEEIAGPATHWDCHTYNIWISCDMNGPPASQITLP